MIARTQTPGDAIPCSLLSDTLLVFSESINHSSLYVFGTSVFLYYLVQKPAQDVWLRILKQEPKKQIPKLLVAPCVLAVVLIAVNAKLDVATELPVSRKKTPQMPEHPKTAASRIRRRTCTQGRTRTGADGR